MEKIFFHKGVVIVKHAASAGGRKIRCRIAGYSVRITMRLWKCLLTLCFLPFLFLFYLRLQNTHWPEGTLFFVETSGSGSLTARMACAVESAAKHHPFRNVAVIFYSGCINQSSPFVQLVQNIPNVKTALLQLDDYFSNTPLEDWYARESWKESPYSTVHLSDALRLVLIWKFGGVYLDLDVVVLKPLDKLVNVVAQSQPNMIANGFLIFNKSHPLLLDCLWNFASTYVPTSWGKNGPELIRRNLLIRCGANSVQEIVGKTCGNTTVLDFRFFLPYNFTMWNVFFDPKKRTEVWNRSKDSYVMHVFGARSKDVVVKIGSKSAYEEAAKIHCPAVYDFSKKLGYF